MGRNCPAASAVRFITILLTSGQRWRPCPARKTGAPSARAECWAPVGLPNPEHGKFLIRVRLSQQQDGLIRVSRLTYEATSEAAEAYARRAEKADPEEPRTTTRRRRRRRSAVEAVKESPKE